MKNLWQKFKDLIVAGLIASGFLMVAFAGTEESIQPPIPTVEFPIDIVEKWGAKYKGNYTALERVNIKRGIAFTSEELLMLQFILNGELPPLGVFTPEQNSRLYLSVAEKFGDDLDLLLDEERNLFKRIRNKTELIK